MIKEGSNWVKFCISKIPKQKRKYIVLDLACGLGKNSVFLAKNFCTVISADIDLVSLKSFHSTSILKIQSDLEKIMAWPFAEEVFDIVVVTNFLNRKIFKNIENSIKKNGYLIYETFGEGQEKFGRPKNKKFLLKKNELLTLTKNLQLIFYEEIKVISGNSKFIKNRILSKNVR